MRRPCVDIGIVSAVLLHTATDLAAVCHQSCPPGHVFCTNGQKSAAISKAPKQKEAYLPRRRTAHAGSPLLTPLPLLAQARLAPAGCFTSPVPAVRVHCSLCGARAAS